MEAHVVIEDAARSRMQSIKSSLKDLMRTQFEVKHSTLEFEIAGAPSDCEDRTVVVQHR